MIVKDLDYVNTIDNSDINGGATTYTYTDTAASPYYSYAGADASAIGEHTYAGVYTSTDIYANRYSTFSTAQAGATAIAQTGSMVSWEQSQSYSKFVGSSTFGTFTSSVSYGFSAGSY